MGRQIVSDERDEIDDGDENDNYDDDNDDDQRDNDNCSMWE